MFFFFFFNDTATTEIYTLSLHDALPISVDGWVVLAERRGPGLERGRRPQSDRGGRVDAVVGGHRAVGLLDDDPVAPRSEEHTSELQSRQYLVCRLLLEKKKTQYQYLLSL